jgi:hypothetical protein
LNTKLDKKKMKRISMTIPLAALGLGLAACGAPAGNTGTNNAAPNTNSNANSNSSKPVAAAPTKEALMTIEKAGWEAWKMRDAKWTEDNYSDKGLNLGSSGRMSKADLIAATKKGTCDIKSYTLSDDRMVMAGPDVAVLTYKGAQDGVCDNKKIPANVWSAAVYVREGDKWKAAYYGEAPVTDPKAAPAKPAAAAPAKKEEAKPAETKPDAGTDALLATEKKAWDDWKNKNAAGLEAWAAKDMTALLDPEGWSDRAAAIKKWTTEQCEVKSVAFSDASSVAYNADTSLLTAKAAVDGTCGGQPLGSMWLATVYVKEAGTWKAVMTMNIPAS